jgi:DNA modification methylase
MTSENVTLMHSTSYINSNINPTVLRTHLTDEDKVHKWYRIIMGFDGRLVKHLIDFLSIKRHKLVLDPYCGSGTTLVECKKNEISSVGIDTNPVCILASRVKTNWKVNPGSVSNLVPPIVDKAVYLLNHNISPKNETFKFLLDSGMINRGWISAYKARRVLSLMGAFDALCTSRAHKDFFRLALVSALVQHIADIKFGPEVYCLSTPKRKPVFKSFLHVTRSMIDDLTKIRGEKSRDVETRVFLADSRKCDEVLSSAGVGSVDFIITSPPYPNEHDYTRCTRLELIFLGLLRNNEQLRQLKRTMIRCNTKGIYIDDDDQRMSEQYEQIRNVALRLERKARYRDDGFSKLYAKMVREYFGGMAVHLKAAYRCLKSKGMCAYVVCDQQSLLGVYVDTPDIIRTIATSPQVGFKLADVSNWRTTKGSRGNRVLTEKILVFSKPAK